jgi:hypothetical protein
MKDKYKKKQKKGKWKKYFIIFVIAVSFIIGMTSIPEKIKERIITTQLKETEKLKGITEKVSEQSIFENCNDISDWTTSLWFASGGICQITDEFSFYDNMTSSNFSLNLRSNANLTFAATTSNLGTGGFFRVYIRNGTTSVRLFNIGTNVAWTNFTAKDIQNNITFTSTMSIRGECYSDGINFDGFCKWDNINVTGNITDNTAPSVNLIAPLNGTAVITPTHSFNMTATDDSEINHVSFHIWNSTNSLINQSNFTLIGSSVSKNLTYALPYYDTFKWNYKVTDVTGNSSFNNTNYTITYVETGITRSVYVLSTDNSTQVIEDMKVNITNSTGKQINFTTTNVTGGAFLTFNVADSIYYLNTSRPGWFPRGYTIVMDSNKTINDEHQWFNVLIVSSEKTLEELYSAYAPSDIFSSLANSSTPDRPCRYVSNVRISIAQIGHLIMESCTLEMNSSGIDPARFIEVGGRLTANYSNITRMGTNNYWFYTTNSSNLTLKNSFVSFAGDTDESTNRRGLEISSSYLLFYNNTLDRNKGIVLLSNNLVLNQLKMTTTSSFNIQNYANNSLIIDSNISGATNKQLSNEGKEFNIIDSNFSNFRLNRYSVNGTGYMNTIWFTNITSGENITCSYSGYIQTGTQCYYPGSNEAIFNGTNLITQANATGSEFIISSSQLNITITNITQSENLTITAKTTGKKIVLQDSIVESIDSSSGDVISIDGSDAGDMIIEGSNITNIQASGGSVTSGNGDGGDGGIVEIKSNVTILGNISVDRGYGSGTGVNGRVGRVIYNFTDSFNDVGARYKGNLTLSILNRSVAKIDWIDEIDGNNIENVSNYIEVTDNLVFVHTENLTALNKSANVTFYNMSKWGFQNPVIFKDGEPCTDCYNLTSLTDDTIIFNVTGFSEYSIVDGIGSVQLSTNCAAPTLVLTNPTKLQQGDNLIITFIQSRSTDSGNEAVNISLYRDGNVLLDTSPWLKMVGTANSQMSESFITYDINAPAYSNYTIKACASQTAVNSEAKMLVINGLEMVSYNKTKHVSMTATEYNSTTIQTSFTPGNNIVLASVKVKGTSSQSSFVSMDLLNSTNGKLYESEHVMTVDSVGDSYYTAFLIGVDENADTGAEYRVLIRNNTGQAIDTESSIVAFRSNRVYKNTSTWFNLPSATITYTSYLKNVNVSNNLTILGVTELKDTDTGIETFNAYLIQRDPTTRLNASEYPIQLLGSNNNWGSATFAQTMANERNLGQVLYNYSLRQERSLADLGWKAKGTLLAFELTELPPDIIPPIVTLLIPSAGTNYSKGQTIEIASNVVDSSSVSQVFANITLPNGTANKIILTLVSGNKYNNSYSIPYLTGRYNITIFANDTLNNLNSSEKTHFNVKASSLSVNITSPSEETIIQINNTFNLNGTISCTGESGGNCGIVYALARYNLTSNADTLINVTAGAIPMHLTSLGNGSVILMNYTGATAANAWHNATRGSQDPKCSAGTTPWCTIGTVYSDSELSNLATRDTTATSQSGQYSHHQYNMNISRASNNTNLISQINITARQRTSNSFNHYLYIWNSTSYELLNNTISTSLTDLTYSLNGNLQKYIDSEKYIHILIDADGANFLYSDYVDVVVTTGSENINPKETPVILNVGEAYNFTWSVTVTGTNYSKHKIDIYFNSSLGNLTTQENDTIDRTICIGACTPPAADSCTYTSGNWQVNCADMCVISSNVNLGKKNITLTGTGTFTVNSNITNFTYISSKKTCYIKTKRGGGFIF